MKIKRIVNYCIFILATTISLFIALPVKKEVATKVEAFLGTKAIASSIGMLASFAIFLALVAVMITPSLLFCTHHKRKRKDLTNE